MTTTTTPNIKQAIAERAAELDAAAPHKTCLDQDEFVVADHFLSFFGRKRK